MLRTHEQNQIHSLFEAGLSATEIAKRTGRSLGTIYKFKKLGRNTDKVNLSDTSRIPPLLIPYQGIIDKGIRNRKKSRDIFFAMQNKGYNDSRHIFESYFMERKQELNPIHSIQHRETDPGEEAQVDWGHFGEITINGRKEKVYLFAYIMSWSRAIYLEFVVRQNQKTLQTCHMNAFKKLGIPKTILYDNMKTVVNHREKLPDGTKKVHFNIAFTEFARYYQFTPEACSPYWPRHKGKVENTIKYVRNYFSRYTPKTEVSIEELNERLHKWVDEKAHQRIHRSTGEKPYDRWLKEKSALEFPGNLPPYNPAPLLNARATQYGLITHKGVTYALGQAFSRKKLQVREVQDHGLPLLEFYYDNKLLKTIPIPSKKHAWVTVFEDLPVIKQKPKTKQAVPQKQTNTIFDIQVEQRDNSYYQIQPGTFGEVSYG